MLLYAAIMGDTHEVLLAIGKWIPVMALVFLMLRISISHKTDANVLLTVGTAGLLWLLLAMLPQFELNEALGFSGLLYPFIYLVWWAIPGSKKASAKAAVPKQ